MQPIAIGYDTIGKIAVALARYSFFGDDVLQVSTLKGKGSKRALDAHKLEALHSFLHSVQPFSNLRKNEFNLLVKGKIDGALKDHLKSSFNRSSLK